MRPGKAAVLGAMAVVLGTSACSAAPDLPAPDQPDPLVLTVLGDSIPFNSPDDCPGCSGFVKSYAEALGEETHRDVVVRNRSRHDGAKTHDIVDQLLDDTTLNSLLTDADIVLTSFGFDDQPPYAFGGPPCQNVNETADEAAWVTAIADTTTDCIDAHTAALGANARTILTSIRELTPDGDIGVLNAYNAWIGWSASSSYPDKLDGLTRSTAYALDSWSTTLCAEAERIDATCIDIYHGFNGDTGLTPAGDLLADEYTHPSQEGNDVIAELLIASGLGRHSG